MISTIKGSPDRIIVAPKDFNNPEEVKDYYSKIGVPANADQYELGEMDDLLSGFAKASLEAGAPKAAVQKQVEFYRQHVQQAAEKAEADFVAGAERELSEYLQSLGNDVQREKAFFTAGQSTFPELAGENSATLERVMGAKNYAMLMAKLGRLSGEDKVLGLGSESATTLRGAETQLAQLKMDAAKMSILSNPNHPQHEAVLGEWNMLHKQLY